MLIDRRRLLLSMNFYTSICKFTGARNLHCYCQASEEPVCYRGRTTEMLLACIRFDWVDTNLEYSPSRFINTRLNVDCLRKLYARLSRENLGNTEENRGTTEAFLHREFIPRSNLEFHSDDWFEQKFRSTLNVATLTVYICELIKLDVNYKRQILKLTDISFGCAAPYRE